MRGLERRSLAAFLAWDCRRVGSDESTISMPLMALRAVFWRRAGRLGMLVSYSPLASEGRKDKILSCGSFSSPRGYVKYIVVSDRIRLCHFC